MATDEQILSASRELQAVLQRQSEAKAEHDDAMKLVDQCRKAMEETDKAVKAAELNLRNIVGGQDRYGTMTTRIREIG
jgi:hypothetical protein